MSRIDEVENLKEQIVKKSQKLKYDIKEINKAIKIAESLHADQKRKSGQPYIIHPLAVANEVTELELGQDAVIAALLHDTIEDCGISHRYIEERFNSIVASLVEGVTKIDALAHNSNKRYTELLNLRKLIISSSEDIRVLLIKLADRLNNMRTIEALNPEKQVTYSDETLKVYVPLAEYLGIGKWKRELEDIAFRKNNPQTYKLLQEKIEEDRRIHDHILDELIQEVKKSLKKQKISAQKIYGRIKSINSIYNKIIKMARDNSRLSEEEMDISGLHDLIAISIILDSDEIECYRVLGLIHSQYEHFPSEFKDYIAKPKANGYRSIHTIINFQGYIVEIHIKTEEMHDLNEFGAASHIAYKLSKTRKARVTNQFRWVKDLSIWSSNTGDETKFKVNAFSDKIFVITPKGKVIELPKGASAIDFAYLIHTEVGNKFIGFKVNDKIGKLEEPLQNGDVVEILTSKTPKKPSLEWIKYAFLHSTKQKIRSNLSLHETDANIQKGKDLIASYLDKKVKVDFLVLDSPILRYLCGEFGASDIDQFYLGIYHGNIAKRDVLKKLISKLNIQQDKEQSEEIKKKEKEEQVFKTSKTNILIEGETDLEFKIAGCCKPIMGDEIIGLVTLRDGLKIHRMKCPSIENIDAERKLTAVWNK